MTAVAPAVPSETESPAWNLSWLTPTRCRLILILVLFLDVVGHINYLHHCPADLSGDEAQYWDWSRHLDWSYYSKGPLIAYIIRASCSIFGETMPAVRYPAILFGVGTSIVTYLVTRKLFRSERLALGAVLLNHLVPMFIAGSILMTIDPPMFFCWALATLCAVHAIFDDRQWAWPLVGAAIGIGFLAKYATPLWYLGAVGYLLTTGSFRKHLGGLLFAGAVTILFTTPVIVWNAQHHWVSLFHVAHQTGASGGSLKRGNFLELIGSQIGVIGPILAVMMVVAIARIRRAPRQDQTRLRFLAWIGVPFLLLTIVTSFFAKVQVNWPAPAYFSLFILTAWFIGDRLQRFATWRPWRMWFWGAVSIALIATPILHDTSLLFPLVNKTNAVLHTRIDPAKVDILYKLRGWKSLGDFLSTQLAQHPDAIILTDDYMQAAETAFYTAGQPKTYYAGSYYSDAKRFTQYDMWPDRNLDRPELKGKTVIFVGKGGALPADIQRVFDRLKPLPDVNVIVRGVKVHAFHTWLGTNFKGMTRPNGPASF